jgi:proteasome assembly chaperone (PAC2) family protein
MNETIDIWERPESKELFLITGWRQWADAGSMSSGLPQYLIKQTGARQIGEIKNDGFYLFQFPGTHDLVRPVVKFQKGYPESLKTKRNELFYTGNSEQGVLILVGDEPHMDIERYVGAVLDIAEMLDVKRIVSFGGVFGELPYDKERLISAIYSLPSLKSEMDRLAVNVSDYHGGASIGSYICKRSGERGVQYVGLFAFVPTYDFSSVDQIGNTIRIENDYMAWYSVMRRVNFMLRTDFDLSDLQKRSSRMVELIDAKIEELDSLVPQLEVRDYMDRLAEDFTEVHFDPLDEVWEEEFRRLFDDDV